MKTIIHTVHIHAAPPAVYRALTTERGVTGWWSTKAKLDPGEGGIIEFTFTGDFHPHMKQMALRDAGGETSLRFVQEYAQELDDDTYGTYNFNWGYYLNSLKQFCENGSGAPFQAAAHEAR